MTRHMPVSPRLVAAVLGVVLLVAALLVQCGPAWVAPDPPAPVTAVPVVVLPTELPTPAPTLVTITAGSPHPPLPTVPRATPEYILTPRATSTPTATVEPISTPEPPTATPERPMVQKG